MALHRTMAEQVRITIFTLLLLGAPLTVVAADGGETLYYACATCHREDGSGSQPLDAPRIAGTASWYVIDQLGKFKNGSRGDHPDDIYGRQMALFAKALADDASIEAVANYVSNLDGPRAQASSAGDAKRGQQLYTTCSACHGENAEGQADLRAPALAGLDDWYLVRQLQNYLAGRRGYAADDTSGQQMRAAATVLETEQDVRAMAMYLASLDAGTRSEAQ